MKRIKVAGRAIGLVLAFLILVYPFTRPSIDFSISKFDRNLVGLSESRRPGGPKGQIDFNTSTIGIRALPGTEPTVYLAGTKSGFMEGLSVTLVSENGLGGSLAMFRVFNPRTGNEVRISFRSPNHVLAGLLFRNFTVFEDRRISHFSVPSQYRIELNVTRFESLQIRISNLTWSYARAWNDSDWLVGDEIFTSIGSYSTKGESLIKIQDYRLQVFDLYPAGVRTSDPLLPPLVIATTVVFGLAYADVLSNGLRKYRRINSSILVRSIRQQLAVLRPVLRSKITLAFILVAIPLLLDGYHIYDLYSFKLWSYLSARYGILSTYPLSHSTTSAIWGQTPPRQTQWFIYPPFTLYVWAAVGVVMSFLGVSNIASPYWDIAIKGTMTVFLYLGSIAVYRISRTDENGSRYAKANYALYLLSPALLVSAALWGESDSILIFFGLMAAFCLRKKRYNSATFFAILTALVKQTGVFLAIPLMLYEIGQAGLRRTLRSLSWSIPPLFLLLVPFLLSGFHPQNLFDFVFYITRRTTGNEISVNSKWVFNLPTLIVMALGLHGRERFMSPDSLIIPALNLTMQQFGVVMLVAALSVLMLIWRRRNSVDQDLYMLVAFFVLAVTMTMTRIGSRYPAFALPFLILGRKQMTQRTFVFVVGVSTLTSTLPQLRDLAELGNYLPYLAPSFYWRNNWFMSVVLAIFSNDTVITGLTLANVLVLCLLARQLVARNPAISLGTLTRWLPRRTRNSILSPRSRQACTKGYHDRCSSH